MTEQTDDDDDGMRPLTPDERKALRKLIQQEVAILEAANLITHSSWFGKVVFRVITFATAIVAFVGALLTVKTWAGWK
jgi:hypothetical protein